tara:strand:- start:5899 stop:6243 length:345 start_codon:yes stop_codon:yes gene_type:complete
MNSSTQTTQEEQPQHDICCVCGKYDDTRPGICDCGGSHRTKCESCLEVHDDEDEDEAYEKRIEALGEQPDDGKTYHACDRLIIGDCVAPVWHSEDNLRYNNEDLHLCAGCWDAV